MEITVDMINILLYYAENVLTSREYSKGGEYIE